LERISYQYQSFYEELFHTILISINSLEMESAEPSISQILTLAAWAVYVMQIILDKTAGVGSSVVEKDLLDNLLHLPSRFTSSIIDQFIIPRLANEAAKQRAEQMAAAACQMFSCKQQRHPLLSSSTAAVEEPSIDELISRSSQLISMLNSSNTLLTENTSPNSTNRWKKCKSECWQVGCASGIVGP
jgi:hypothetical protein